MNWHMQHKSNLTLGQRAADLIRNGMGSWGFVFLALIFLAMWMVTNGFKYDIFPWILLNLLLSCLAALQGAILLIASKRQDEISAALAQHDYETNIAAKKEIDLLLEEMKKLNLIISKLDKQK